MPQISNPSLKKWQRAGTDDPRGLTFYDSALRGFYVQVFPSGRLVFGIRYGTRSHRRRMTLGEWGNPLTLEIARRKAMSLLASAQLGGDPAHDKTKRSEMPTFRKWAEEYLEEVGPKRKSATTIAYYLRLASAVFGATPLDRVEGTDVAGLQRSLRKTPTQSNRAVASVAACFALAERRGLISRNPCVSVEPFPENPPRDRILSLDELGRLRAAIEAEEDLHVRAAFRLLLETGARCGEVLAAKWEDLDLVGLRWRLPSPKAGTPQTIFLHETTAEWLRDLPRVGPYVIPGLKKDSEPEDGTAKEPSRRYDLKKPWLRLQREAQLQDVTIHDLRRTFGKLVAQEAGLQAAQKALRHQDVTLTAKVYAPMHEAEVRGAIGKVIPITRRKSA